MPGFAWPLTLPPAHREKGNITASRAGEGMGSEWRPIGPPGNRGFRVQLPESVLTHHTQAVPWPVFWSWISRLGQAEVVLPCVLLSVLWLLWARAPRLAGAWMALLLLAAGLTVATKVAFMGWGVGIASLDFTGISGHAMLSAAVWPVVLGILATHVQPASRRGAIAAGYGLAALIAGSRVMLDAHSPAEAIGGCLLGSLASGVVLAHNRYPHRLTPAWLSLSLILWLAVVPAAAPQANAQGLIIRLALKLSDHSRPFTRAHLHKPAYGTVD
jgi:membrane-associated phospholipid phosphatase